MGRTRLRVALAALLYAAACSGSTPGNASTVICIDASGPWTMTLGSGGAAFTWTLSQSGCDISVTENGAHGTVRDGQLHLDWSWSDSCGGPSGSVPSVRTYRASVSASVEGGAMSGEMSMMFWSTGNCWGSGTSTQALSGVRG